MGNKTKEFDFHSLAHYIPKELTRTLNITALSAIVTNYMIAHNYKLPMVVDFTQNLVDLQLWREQDSEEHSVKFFPAHELLDVKFFNREKNDALFGAKARLHFVSTGYSRGKPTEDLEEQYIDTHFLASPGMDGGSKDFAKFTQAQARTVAAEAIRGIGVKGSIEKLTINKNEGRSAISYLRGYDRENPYPKHPLDSVFPEDLGFSYRDKNIILGNLLLSSSIEDATDGIADFLGIGSGSKLLEKAIDITEEKYTYKVKDDDPEGFTIKGLADALQSYEL